MTGYRKESARAGWRRIAWQGSYRPVLGLSGSPADLTDPAGLGGVDLVHHIPPPAGVPGRATTAWLDHLATAGLLAVVALADPWWERPTRSAVAWIRRWGKAVAPYPQTALQLALPPAGRTDPETELRLERLLEETRRVSPTTMTVALVGRSAGDLGPALRLGRLTHLAGAEVVAGGADELLLPLLAQPHDRPALIRVRGGRGSPWRTLTWALGCSLGGVILQGPPNPATTRRLEHLQAFLEASADLAWTDPAQEKVTVLVTATGRAALRPCATALAALSRLGVAARISLAEEPLGLDKQKIILVPAPGPLLSGTLALLLRRAHLGARVVITGRSRPADPGHLDPKVVDLLVAGGHLDWGGGSLDVVGEPIERTGLEKTVHRYRDLLAHLLPEQPLQDPTAGLMVRPWTTTRGWGLAAWCPPGGAGRVVLPGGGTTRLSGGGHLLAGQEGRVLHAT